MGPKICSYQVEGPVAFRRFIEVTIEHSHANKLGLDYASIAYWYREEPHKPFPPLIPVEERLPRPDEPGWDLK